MVKKISILFLFIITSSVIIYSQTDVQNIRLSYKSLNKPLPIVLKELSTQTKVNIIFTSSKIKVKKLVTINAINERLVDILANLLPAYRLSYEVVGNEIVVVPQREINLNEVYSISGYIYDKQTKEPLPYASIYTEDRTKGVFSNEEGFYSFKLRRGTYRILTSYIGYIDDTTKIYIKNDSTINYFLRNGNILNEIVVQEDLSKASLRYGEDYVSNNQMNKSLFLGGEPDLIKGINTFPGVATDADGFGGLSVRGGNYDQNLILFDGIPVQNTGHGFGLISIFNSSIVQDARLIKSIFPARYGGRLSSILDIKSKDGNKNRFGGEVSISTLTSKALLEGPILKDKISFIFGYRRTFADPWIKGLTRFINENSGAIGETTYFFEDLNGKLSFQLNKKNNLSISYYKGRDALQAYSKTINNSNNVDFIEQSNNDQRWGNDLLSGHLNTQIGNTTFLKTTIYLSNWSNDNFKFNRLATDSLGNVLDLFSSHFKGSELNANGIRVDLDKQLSTNNLLKTGVHYTLNEFTPKFNSITNLNDTIYPNSITKESILKNIKFSPLKSIEISAYVEDEIRMGSAILNLGLHFSNYQFDTTTYRSFQPRVSLQISNESSWFHIGASMMRQYSQVLSENNLGFPTDLWVNATKFIKPADAYNGSIGIGFFVAKRFTLNFNGYFKYMKNIIALGEGLVLQVPNEIADWEKDIPRGKGIAYGLEASVEYSTDRLNFESNITIGNSQREFLDLNNGQSFPYKNNRTYMVNTLVGIKIGKITDLTTQVAFQDGNYTSFPTGGVIIREMNGNKFIYPIFDKKNNYKFDNYIRWDIGLTFKAKNKLGQHRVFVGLYNVLNRKNPLYFDISRNTFDVNVLDLKKVSIFPILPSISYNLKF